jgi:hypothetical protein
VAPADVIGTVSDVKGARLMKAVVMHEYDSADVLKDEDFPDPALSCTGGPVKTQSR